MTLARATPGVCPICGTAHTACTASRGPVAVVQLPARDALELAPTVPLVVETPVPLVAEVVQASLPPGQVTTGTYRGRGKKST